MWVYAPDGFVSLKPLVCRMLDEKEDFTEDVSQADLILCEEFDNTEKQKPFYGGGLQVPHVVGEMMRMQGGDGKLFFVTKWFDKEKGFEEQTFLGMPVFGVLNEDFAPALWSATAGRFVRGDVYAEYFSYVESFFRDLGYRGPVNIFFRDDWSPSHVLGGNPYGVVELLAGLTRQRLASFLVDPFVRKFESWTVGLVVTRSPYPKSLRGAGVVINLPKDKVRRHVWLEDEYGEPTYSTRVGFVTWFDARLSDADHGAIEACRTLDVGFKQYRTDTRKIIVERWASIRERFLL